MVLLGYSALESYLAGYWGITFPMQILGQYSTIRHHLSSFFSIYSVFHAFFHTKVLHLVYTPKVVTVPRFRRYDDLDTTFRQLVSGTVEPDICYYYLSAENFNVSRHESIHHHLFTKFQVFAGSGQKFLRDGFGTDDHFEACELHYSTEHSFLSALRQKILASCLPSS
jgi:hypothetical protein